MVLCHPRWLPTSGLTEFAVCWGGAGFKPRTTDFAVRCATIEPPLLLRQEEIPSAGRNPAAGSPLPSQDEYCITVL
jgi:hypothetical protein